jgi:hypothetical protein
MQEQSARLQPIVVETRRGVEQFQRIRETLARVELTDGFTFAQLVEETVPRVPRDATILAILPDVAVETALVLGNLRRRGFAVTVVLIQCDVHQLERCYGRLMAEGVRDVRHLANESGLPELCGRQALGQPAVVLESHDGQPAQEEEPPEWSQRTTYHVDHVEE